MEVPWETEAAGDQVKTSNRRRSQGKASTSRSRSCDEIKLLLSRIDIENSVEEKKDPPPPAGEKEKEWEEELRLLDENEAAQEDMDSFRRGWEVCYGDLGYFEDNTSLCSMRYTEGAIPSYACIENVLQIFSVQVIETKDGLEWPLHVYGFVATRDSVDQKRNILFNRTRDNCQILTQEDSYLLLTGPSRAVVFIDPVAFEVQLKVKGKTESEDKILCLDVFEHHAVYSFVGAPFMIQRSCSSKLCKLNVTFAPLDGTVEATVAKVQVIDGSWPDHVRGKVIAHTVSIGKGNIMLLDSRDGRMPITCDGEVKLSRNVVSVEFSGQLKVRVVASQIDNGSDVIKEDMATDVIKEDMAIFTPLKASFSHGTCDLGFCKVEITIAWSLLAGGGHVLALAHNTSSVVFQSTPNCVYSLSGLFP